MRFLCIPTPVIFVAFGCATPLPARAVADNAALQPAESSLRPQAKQSVPLAEQSPRSPRADTQCPLTWKAHDLGNVLVLPAAIVARPMERVIQALCACTQPGEHLAVVAHIDFFNGTVRSVAPEAPAVDRCLAQVTGKFEPFRPDGPATDCIDCGPKRYGVFHGSSAVDVPESPSGIRLTYPFRLDRSNEVLSCARGMRAQEGKCVADQAVTLPPAPATNCACAPLDLRCAIDCEAAR